MDTVNIMMNLQRKTFDFRKSASDTNYKAFLNLFERADTKELCLISDSYDYSQKLRIFHQISKNSM